MARADHKSHNRYMLNKLESESSYTAENLYLSKDLLPLVLGHTQKSNSQMIVFPLGATKHSGLQKIKRTYRPPQQMFEQCATHFKMTRQISHLLPKLHHLAGALVGIGPKEETVSTPFVAPVTTASCFRNCLWMGAYLYRQLV